MDIIRELFYDLPRQGPGTPEYTRTAVEATGLHRSDSARVLDVGCGSGASTLVLAGAYPFHVLAVDVSQELLNRLDARVAEQPVRGSIETRCISMFDLAFDDGEFDAIWSEGAVYFLGFAEGLRRWRSFVRPGGFVVLSELTWLTETPSPEVAAFWREAYPAMTTVRANCSAAEALGYRMLEPIVCGEDAFWPRFYEPLEARVAALEPLHEPGTPEHALLEENRREIALYRKYSDQYSYVFYLCEVTA